MPQVRRVLLVDDEPFFLENLAEYMASPTVETYTASSAAQAVTLVEAVQFDLVITDLFMPEIGGGELIRYLMCNHPDVPTIVMTGYLGAEVQENLVEMGVSHLVEKPIDLDVLMSRVAEVLDKRTMAEETAT